MQPGWQCRPSFCLPWDFALLCTLFHLLAPPRAPSRTLAHPRAPSRTLAHHRAPSRTIAPSCAHRRPDRLHVMRRATKPVRNVSQIILSSGHSDPVWRFDSFRTRYVSILLTRLDHVMLIPFVLTDLQSRLDHSQRRIVPWRWPGHACDKSPFRSPSDRLTGYLSPGRTCNVSSTLSP